jgi:hypothetical protein
MRSRRGAAAAAPAELESALTTWNTACADCGAGASTLRHSHGEEISHSTDIAVFNRADLSRRRDLAAVSEYRHPVTWCARFARALSLFYPTALVMAGGR